MDECICLSKNVFFEQLTHRFLSFYYTFQPENRFKFQEMRVSNSEVKFNLEVKFFYLYRFLMSYAVKPEYFVQISSAMDKYAVDYTTRMSIAGAFDHISRGIFGIFPSP